MKALLTLALLLPSLSFADQTAQRILKDTTTIVALDLNEKSVFCTSRGYGTNQLKISLPDLEYLAHFDHRVVGETVPCITGGECVGQLQPGNFIDLNNPINLVPVRVTLTQEFSISDDGKTCTQTISEHVSSLVKGREFHHDKSSDPEPLDVEKCKKLLLVP